MATTLESVFQVMKDLDKARHDEVSFVVPFLYPPNGLLLANDAGLGPRFGHTWSPVEYGHHLRYGGENLGSKISQAVKESGAPGTLQCRQQKRAPLLPPHPLFLFVSEALVFTSLATRHCSNKAHRSMEESPRLGAADQRLRANLFPA